MNATACLVARQQPEGKFWFCSFGNKKEEKTKRNDASSPPSSLISASSCAERGGLTWKRPGRTSDTGTAGGPCVSGSVA